MKKGLILGFSAVAFIVALVAFVQLNSNKERSYFPRFSTRFTDEFGLHVLYRLLETEGYPVEKNYYTFENIPGGRKDNYIFIAPSYYVEDTEHIEIRKSVIDGAWLIVVPGRYAYNPLDNLGIFRTSIRKKSDWDHDLPNEIPINPQNQELRQPLPQQEPANLDSLGYVRKENPKSRKFWMESINEDFTGKIVSAEFPLRPWLTDSAGNTLAGVAGIGKGGVVVLTHPFVFCNQGLKNPENVRFVSRLFAFVYARNPKPFVFDENHQGFRAKEIASPVYVPEIRYAIIGLILLLLVAVLSATRRPMRIVPITREPRRSILEYVRAMANIYYRRNGNYFLFMEACVRFISRLNNVLGITHGDTLKDPKAAVTLAKTKWNEEEARELANLLTQIRKQYNEQKSDLKLIQRIRQFSIRNKLDKHIHAK